MSTIFQSRDQLYEKRALVNPEDVISPVPGFPEICVSTFSEAIVQKYASFSETEIIAWLYTANGRKPVYQLQYKGQKIAFYCSLVGAPACVAGIEEIRVMGAKKLVLFGSCGLLDEEAEGKIIIPTAAVRDEGTSWHYVLPSDEIQADEQTAAKMAAGVKACGYPYIEGKTWTTDAIYRETAERVQEQKDMGCIAVEMECAAAMAVAKFREFPFAQFLYGADSLSQGEWEPRDLAEHGLSKADRYMALAFEIGLRL